MSIVKFQAWDNQNQQMFQVRTLGIGGKYVEIYGQRLVPTAGRTAHMGRKSDRIYAPHYSLRQFTGLLDKNGVEIYEGDILKHYTSWQGMPDVLILDVTFDRGAFTTRIAQIPNSDVIEVIGNIYENPELLTKEQEE